MKKMTNRVIKYAALLTMVVATTAVVSVGEFVPFVIHARPNSDSLIKGR